MDAPSLRFSKSAEMGTRVPWNTHAPLSLPEWRSTASHSAQLVIGSSRFASLVGRHCDYSVGPRLGGLGEEAAHGWGLSESR